MPETFQKIGTDAATDITYAQPDPAHGVLRQRSGQVLNAVPRNQTCGLCGQSRDHEVGYEHEFVQQPRDVSPGVHWSQSPSLAREFQRESR